MRGSDEHGLSVKPGQVTDAQAIIVDRATNELESGLPNGRPESRV
jgi:hypothetical protein